MKNGILLLVLLLPACGTVPAAGSPASQAAPTIQAFTLPPAWTETPTGTETHVSTNALSPAESGTPSTIGTPTDVSIPQLTPLPVTPVFDAGTDTLLAFVQGGWIYAANWEGETTPLWFLGSDVFVTGGVMHLEISPDRKQLAFSGIGSEDSRPALEVFSLDTLQVNEQAIFPGTMVADFAWSPDSQSLLASVMTVRSAKDFDTAIYRIDLGKGLLGEPVFSEAGSGISQVEWPDLQRAAYLDFTCSGAPTIEDSGYPEIIGRTGVGVLNLQTGNPQHIFVADNIYFLNSKLVLSPDQTQMVYLGTVQMTGGGTKNLLYSTVNLASLPCSFCRGYADLVWMPGLMLADNSMTGFPGGGIFLLDKAGGSRQILQYENLPPRSKLYAARGVTAWIDDQSQVVGSPAIAVSDIQACLPGDADMSTCRREMWTIGGEWPDGYNDSFQDMWFSCAD